MENQQNAQMSVQQGIDQLGAALRDVAPVVATYYVRLREGGVPKNAALMLTAEMQEGVLSLLLTPTVEGRC